MPTQVSTFSRKVESSESSRDQVERMGSCTHCWMERINADLMGQAALRGSCRRRRKRRPRVQVQGSRRRPVQGSPPNLYPGRPPNTPEGGASSRGHPAVSAAAKATSPGDTAGRGELARPVGVPVAPLVEAEGGIEVGTLAGTTKSYRPTLYPASRRRGGRHGARSKTGPAQP